MELPALLSAWSSHGSWNDEQNLRLTTPPLHFPHLQAWEKRPEQTYLQITFK